jgi:hypothetical protein
MTIAQLQARLGLFTDDKLEVLIRCQWEGDSPSSNVFMPRLCVQDIDHDTAVDFIAIECDQTDED